MRELPPAPKRLGRFEVLERIAVGGMAEVFLARERGVRGLERLVVLKRVIPHLAVEEQYVEMFVREAKFAASINHPNIVQIHELGEDNGAFYMAMEYVPGVSLKKIMSASIEQRSAIPIDVACAIVAQACSGLHAAHELKDSTGRPIGLVHRDVSPHNVMVTGEGHVKVLDFGIAKATETGADLTKAGTLKGKVHYMSPEQCRQEPLDRRSDVFALGIVLWELFSGELLFKRKNDLETMEGIVGGKVPDPRDKRPELPAAIARSVLRALSVEPGLRQPTAEALRKELELAAEQHGLRLSPDAIRPYVTALVGPTLEESRTRGHRALERTRELSFDKEDAQTKVEGSGSHSGMSRPRPEAVAPTETAAAETPLERTSTRTAAPVHAPASFDDRAVAEKTSETPLEPRPASVTRAEPSRMRRARAPLALVLASVAAIAGALVLFSRVRDFSTTPAGPPIKVGVAPIMDPALILKDLEPLRAYLQRTVNRPVELHVTSSYGDLAEKLLAGSVHFGSLPPYTYLETKMKNDAVEVLAIKLLDGSWGSDGVLLVLERTVDSIKELRGKTWCFPDERSTTGFVLPRRAFKRAGLDPDVDLKMRRTGNHLQSLRDLNAGLCDVAGSYSGVLLNAEAASIPVGRMRTLEITGRAPADAIVAGPAVAPAIKAEIKRAFLAFSPAKEIGTPTLGSVEHISGFAEGSDDQYDALRAAIKDLEVP